MLTKCVVPEQTLKAQFTKKNFIKKYYYFK